MNQITQMHCMNKLSNFPCVTNDASGKDYMFVEAVFFIHYQ